MREVIQLDGPLSIYLSIDLLYWWVLSYLIGHRWRSVNETLNWFVDRRDVQLLLL